MNIFNLPLEEAEKEIEKMIKSVPKEQLIQDLKECGLMNKQDKKEIMNLIKYKKMLGDKKMYINQRVYIPSANMEGIIKKINGRDLTIKLDCGLTIETDKREVVIAIADMFHNEEVEE